MRIDPQRDLLALQVVCGQLDHLLIVMRLDLASALHKLVQIFEYLEFEIVFVAQTLVLLDQHGFGETHKTLLAGRLWRSLIFDTHLGV